jgi:ribosomal protein L24E
MKHLLRNLGLCATLLAAVPVGAHTAKQSDPVKALHGGQSLAAGPYHLELVAKDGELVLYVADHSDKAIPTDGAKAKATIQHGYEKAKIQVELEPSGENTLKGTGEFTIHLDTGIIVFLRLPEHEAYAARFTPRDTKRGAAQTGGHHHPQKD